MRSTKVNAAHGAQILALALIASAGFPARLAAQNPPAIVEAPVGWFGVTISDNALMDDKLNTFFNSYPVVSAVEPGSPAAKAGVRRGDVLISFDSHDMGGGALLQLKSWLRPGAPFVLQLRRNNQIRQVRGVLVERPEGWEEVNVVTLTPREAIEGQAGSMGGGPMLTKVGTKRRMPAPEPLPTVLAPAMGYGGGVYPFAGAEFTALNDDLSEALGVKREGVFVTNVMDGSAARAAGLRGGDIILKADGVKTNTPFDLVGAIRNASMRSTTNHSIELQILRKQKSQTHTQTLTLRW